MIEGNGYTIEEVPVNRVDHKVTCTKCGAHETLPDQGDCLQWLSQHYYENKSTHIEEQTNVGQ